MTALTCDRDTPRRLGQRVIHPVAAGVTIWAGALVALDAAGDAVPGSTATGLRAVGRATHRAGNISGAESVEIERGCFLFANDGSIDRTRINSQAYIVDDQTVAATNGGGTRSPAGFVRDIDGAGVWIEF